MSSFSMKKQVLAAATLLASLGLAQTANAAPVDFESIALGSYSSFSSGGITFSLSAGDLTVSDDGNGVYVLAAPGTHFLDNRYGGSSFRFDLAATSSYFGLQIGATNDAQTLSAYDSSNVLLGSLAIPDQVDTMGFPHSGFYSLSYTGISSVVLSADNGDWIVVDNVALAPVPEPEPCAMMMAGLGLLALATRRRKQSQASA